MSVVPLRAFSQSFFDILFVENVVQPEIIEPIRYKVTEELLRPGRIKEQSKKQVCIGLRRVELILCQLNCCHLNHKSGFSDIETVMLC